MRQKRRSYRESEDDEDGNGDDIAAVNDRLDALTRQLERMAQANATPSPPAPPAASVAPPQAGTDMRADRVSDALARLDRRLDQVIAEGRAAASEHRARYTPPPAPPMMPPPAPAYVPAPPPMAAPVYAPAPQPQAAANRGPAHWAAQISARQRMLEGGAAAAPAAPVPVAPVAVAAPANWSGGSDFSGLQHQLHQLNTQISTLHQPYENAFIALRSDLAEIGRAPDRGDAAAGDRGA